MYKSKILRVLNTLNQPILVIARSVFRNTRALAVQEFMFENSFV